MRITKLSLIDETEEYYIFSVSFKSFFGGEKNRTAINRKDAWVSSSYWADTGERIENDKAIDAWLTTDKKDFNI